MKKKAQRTEKEKAKIVIEALRGRLTLGEIGKKYSVDPKQIGKWRKLFLSECHLVFEKSSNNQEQSAKHQKELELLYEQIGRLQVENNFLKKTLVST